MTPRAIAARNGWICGLCGQPVDPYENWEIDHIVPRAEGGDDSDTNKQLAHYGCHRRKTTRDVKRMAKTRRLRNAFELHDRIMRKKERRLNARDRARARMDRNRNYETIAERQE